MSRVCLPLTAPTLEENRRIVEAQRPYLDLVELQADTLDPAELPSLGRFPSLVGLPAALTARRPADGGRFGGSEAERRRILARAAGGYAYVELEEDVADPVLEKSLREGGCRIIRSFHDLEATPADLAGRLARLARREDEIPKAAVMVRGVADLEPLLGAFEGLEGRRKILLGLGPFGACTRILAGRLGSWLTVAAPPGEEPAAAEPDPRLLHDLYRFKELGRQTPVYGVIGNPIAHSRSPEIHNRGYQALGMPGVYLPFLVDDAPAFLGLAPRLGVRGLSVTIPYKQAVLAALAGRDEAVEAVGACNTAIHGAGGWYGTNTDVEGFLAPLRRQAPEVLRPGARATVVGAGGAARAVVYALRRAGVEVLVLNRTPSRAAALAGRFGAGHAGLDRRGLEAMAGYRDLVVQSTPAGMEPQEQSDPVAGYRFQGSEVVYDLVYRPHWTALLRRAARAGCRTVHGIDMLQAQAEAQFRLFTGSDYPHLPGAGDSRYNPPRQL